MSQCNCMEGDRIYCEHDLERKLKAYEVQLSLAREGLEKIRSQTCVDYIQVLEVANDTLSKLSEGEGGVK